MEGRESFAEALVEKWSRKRCDGNFRSKRYAIIGKLWKLPLHNCLIGWDACEIFNAKLSSTSESTIENSVDCTWRIRRRSKVWSKKFFFFKLDNRRLCTVTREKKEKILFDSEKLAFSFLPSRLFAFFFSSWPRKVASLASHMSWRIFASPSIE